MNKLFKLINSLSNIYRDFMSIVLSVLIICTLLMPTSSFAQQPTGSNHFKTWRAQGVPFLPPVEVFVQDQFMFESRLLIEPEFLSNPVLKVHQDVAFPIVNPNDHLIWYRFAEGPLVDLSVEYVNQFESTMVALDSVKYLLVPAQKEQHPPPENLDHYKAYSIVKPKTLNFQTPVELQDQFDIPFGLPELIDSIKQRYFLTPASKNSEPMYDHVTHYVAYEIFPKRDLILEVFTLDQFGEHFLQIGNSEFLLVPTLKTPNHFKTWRTEPLQFDQMVFVKDQFGMTPLHLAGIEFLSNPAMKTHQDITYEILNQNDHLTWYRAEGEPTSLDVGYINQFESTAVSIDSVKFLLVPTQKGTHDVPWALDHYKAYRIADPSWLTIPVTLEDQFDVMGGFVEFIDSIKPTYFLTPALKSVMEPIFMEPLFDSVHHYVAYEIMPKHSYTLDVNTYDQFGAHILQVLNSEFLLVPSIKFIPPPPPDTGKNHYKTWRTEPLPFQVTVNVRDQFMTDDLQLSGIEFLSNPVMKTHKGIISDILKPDDHLTWYRAEGRDTLLMVNYVNQFESTAVPIGSTEYLLVPTQKFPHAPPESLDHYKAYQIINPVTYYDTISLEDQFDVLFGLPESIDSLRSLYFLTPAMKNFEPMYDTVTHYVAYEIFPKRIFQYPVTTQDQFGVRELPVLYSDLLLVPTTKLSVGPPPDSLLGSLCGKKCKDLNGNGVCDPTEPVLPNWSITLSDPTGGGTSILTNQQGAYCFTGLLPGQYTISETMQPGWQQTGPQPPGTYTVNLQLGQHVTGLDFANIRIPDFDSLMNHYKAWRTVPYEFNTRVRVEDQFMTDSLQLFGIEFLSNPVRKTRYNIISEIVKPNDHLTWYRAEGIDTLLKVSYINQFESTAVLISAPEYLLVPTQKEPHAPPESLDHYKAYRIEDPSAFSTSITLQDQFDVTGPEYIGSLEPLFFLTPASKNMEMMYDSVMHYVAYLILPQTPLQLSVVTHDQFGVRELLVQNSEILLVPTLKLSISPPYDSVSVGVNAGWNMLSVPLVVNDFRKSVLFPSAISDAFAYEGAYISKDTLENGVGYWLKFSASEIIDLVGSTISAQAINVIEGWNLIGSISEPVPTASITSIPGGIITTEFFEYKSAYQSSDTLEPGKGYWVKVSQAGQLILSSTSTAALNRIRIVPTSEIPPLPPDLEEAGIKSIPVEYSLGQNYPNPFNPMTMIRFDLPEDALVKLTIYNTLGQTVAVLLDGKEISAGSREIELDAGSLPSGVYYYRLVATGKNGNTFASVKKMLILK